MAISDSFGTQYMRAIRTAKTRPTDTTGYTADDVISESDTNGTGTAWTFDNVVADPGGSGWITKAWLQTVTANTGTMTLLLFNAAPTGELDDNAANTSPVVADTEEFIGAINFPALADKGTGQSYAIASLDSTSNLPLRFRCADGSRALYGVLVTSAFTPASAQVFTIELTVDKDS